MRNKGFLVGVALLLVLILTIGCGIPKEDYEALVAERYSAQTELQSVKGELDVEQSKVKNLQSDLTRIDSLVPSLENKQALVDQLLAFEIARSQSLIAKNEGREEESKRLTSLGVSILESYDPLVEGVGDLELSRLWGEAWPEGAREASRAAKAPSLSFKSYV